MRAYAVTVFVGAFLLFQVQPLIGKYLLPWFGGGPSVWTTCLFFFQALLVAGYAYAHLLTRYVRGRLQPAIHLGLLVGALASLPIVPSPSWKPVTPESPSIAILVLLAWNIGLPYFVLAATGPLLQKWSSSVSQGSPYRLYAWSNLGSLLALISYPFAFEIIFTRKLQASFWAWGLVLYCIACGFCAVKAWRASRQIPAANAKTARGADNVRPNFKQRLFWLLWPGCASVLLLATTNKLCLDVAVVPLLWVVPLCLYLLSFIVCFAGERWYWRSLCTVAAALATAALSWALFKGNSWPFWKQICIYGGGLFICCLVCHGELFRIRPGADLLTEFYLLIAIGGALGGLFVALISPVIFTYYYELHWGLALCALLIVCMRTAEGLKKLVPKWDQGMAGSETTRRVPSRRSGDFTGLALAALWLWFFSLCSALWLNSYRSSSEIIHKSRNFYGVLTVFEHRKDEPNGHHLLLQHGRITHGLQLAAPGLQTLATTYYGPESGLGLAFNALPDSKRRVGVVGLGTGTIANYARAEDYFRFYEINPQVSCLATSLFSNLKNCRGKWELTRGDARLALEQQPPQAFDLLALDAFNSDSIPIHLLTKEAIEIYLKHLQPKGILAVHISNHFLDLEPVVMQLARSFGMQTALIDHDAKPEQWWIYSSTWILLCRDRQTLDAPAIRSAAKAPRELTLRLWTDDFSSLFQILRKE